MLTSLAVVSFVLSSASARRRPTKLEASAGRLPNRWLDLVTVIEMLLQLLAINAGRLGTQWVFPRMCVARPPPNLTAVSDRLPTRRVEVRFVGRPPTRRVECAQGVSDVEVDGSVLRCSVTGSFQPLLDALRGYEVLDLDAVSVEKEGCTAPKRISP
jgi:hypothetical protein